MSIETIGLRAIITTDTRPRDYVNKYIKISQARRDYFQESVKLSQMAVNKRIALESEKIADINRFNKNGYWSPSPNLTFHKSLKIQTAYSAMAQAERRKISTHNTHIIYAIEEPETSQHTQHQLKLIETLKKLSLDTNSQIIITTHSPRIVKELAYENIIMVTSIDNSRRLINIEKSLLPYPSLNEVNYLAFNEITEEYHDELYGHIYEMKLMKEFLAQYDNNMEYRYPSNINNGKIDKVCLSKYIRDQIHHPENKLNNKYTLEQLEESINRMRLFIQNKNS